MTFLTLQDELRDHIRARIRRRELTGSGLARAAGFPQGHLSNFLNSRRGLSLESMDRLLQTLGIEVLDLVSADDIQDRSLQPSPQRETEAVAMVALDERSAGALRSRPGAGDAQLQQSISATAATEQRQRSRRLAALCRG